MTLNALCASGIMPMVVDVIVAIIMMIFVIVCAKKGFVSCVFGFISTIVALIAAFALATFVVDMTGGLFGLGEVLENTLISSFSNISGFDIPLNPDADLTELLASQDMHKIFVNLIAQNWAGADIAGRTLGEITGHTVAQFATAAIAGVALFIVLKIVFVILKKVFNFIVKGGLLGFVNRILGAVIGLVEAVLFASLAVMILSLIPSMIPFINSSFILSMISEYNPLMWLIALFLAL